MRIRSAFWFLVLPGLISMGDCARSHAASLAGWAVPVPGAIASHRAKPLVPLLRSGSPYRRVPSHFGKLGLSNRQREAIYRIRGDHRATIDDLMRQVEALKAMEIEACEAILTPAQRRLLEQERTAAGK